MAGHKKDDERTRASEKAAADDGSGSTLLPMLVAGLVLIVLGAIIVMSFV